MVSSRQTHHASCATLSVTHKNCRPLSIVVKPHGEDCIEVARHDDVLLMPWRYTSQRKENGGGGQRRGGTRGERERVAGDRLTSLVEGERERGGMEKEERFTSQAEAEGKGGRSPAKGVERGRGPPAAQVHRGRQPGRAQKQAQKQMIQRLCTAVTHHHCTTISDRKHGPLALSISRHHQHTSPGNITPCHNFQYLNSI